MISAAELIALPPIETRQQISPERVILYALGVGATELPFVYEKNLQVLPTMAAKMAFPGFFWTDPRYQVDYGRVLAGETSVEWHAPLPCMGEVIGLTSFGPVFDKGLEKGAVVYSRRELFDSAGTPLATIRSASVLRGDGGCGGSTEPQPGPCEIPNRVADMVITLPTSENQAMIYRLSGDMNPLHIDPEAAAGFPKPILHGLCTFAVAGRALLSSLCGNIPARLKRMDARFSSPVYPGETIATEIWDCGNGQGFFRCYVPERNLVVLNNGMVRYS